jgi:hypothetical protein
MGTLRSVRCVTEECVSASGAISEGTQLVDKATRRVALIVKTPIVLVDCRPDGESDSPIYYESERFETYRAIRRRSVARDGPDFICVASSTALCDDVAIYSDTGFLPLSRATVRRSPGPAAGWAARVAKGSHSAPAFPGPEGRAPRAYFGMLLSGEKVIASEAAVATFLWEYLDDRREDGERRSGSRARPPSHQDSLEHGARDGHLANVRRGARICGSGSTTPAAARPRSRSPRFARWRTGPGLPYRLTRPATKWSEWATADNSDNRARSSAGPMEIRHGLKTHKEYVTRRPTGSTVTTVALRVLRPPSATRNKERKSIVAPAGDSSALER